MLLYVISICGIQLTYYYLTKYVKLIICTPGKGVVGGYIWTHWYDWIDSFLDLDSDYNLVDLTNVALQNLNTVVSSLAVNRQRLAVCLRVSHKIKVYNHGGDALFDYGSSRGPGEQQLDKPCDICLDSRNNLYVADSANMRIVLVNANNEQTGHIHIGAEPCRIDLLNTMLYVGCFNKTILTYRLTLDSKHDVE